MKKTLEPYQLIERSIIKKYRKELWTPFIVAVKRYELVQAGDRIAVCISGGKDSMLMAKLMQELQRHSDVPFELVFLVMDPGYNEINRQKIESNAELLHIPVTIFESNIFAVANNTDKNPCYLCARMRRGHLYSKAKELGCNKIALGHHFNDVIETTVMSMFYGSQLQAMPPKLHSTSFPGMTLIRPMYCIHEEDILAWKRYNELEFIQCACRLRCRPSSWRSRSIRHGCRTHPVRPFISAPSYLAPTRRSPCTACMRRHSPSFSLPPAAISPTA